MKFLSLFFIFLLISPSFSQDYNGVQSRLNKIDSLTFTGNFDEAEKSLNGLREQFLNDSTTDKNIINVIHKINETFTTLMKNIRSVKTVNSAYNKKLINSYKSNRDFYANNLSGELAGKAFAKFLILSDSENIATAIKFYQVANFSRTIFLEISLLKARKIYRTAIKHFDAGHFEKAMDTIEKLNTVSYPNRKLARVQDSLTALRGKIQNIRDENERQRQYWSRSVYPKRHFSIFFGSSLFRQGSVKDQMLLFNNDGFKTDFLLQNIPGKYRMGFSLGAEYLLKDRFAVGGILTTTRFNYSSESDQQLFSYDYKVKYTSFHLYSKYLLRPYIGLQPFLGIGAGSIRYNREESTLSVISISEDIPPVFTTNRYKITGKSLTNWQLLFDFGIQYVRDANSRLSLGFKWTLYDNLKSFDSVSRVSYYFTTYLRILI